MTQRLTHDVLSFDYPANPPVAATLFFPAHGAGTWNVQSAIARNGRKAIRFQPSANQAWVEKFGVGFETGLTVRFYIEFETFPNADCYLVSWRDNASPTTKHEGIAFNSATNRLRPCVGGTNWGTDGSVLSLGVWYRIDLDFTYNISTDAFAWQWQIDGVGQTDYKITSALGSDAFNRLRLGNWDANCTGDFSIDDYVALQGLGSYPTYPIGPGECFYRTGVSDGSHNNASDFSDEVPNSPPASVFNRLDEGPSTSTTDYVSQGTANSASYLEIATEDIISEATRMHGGVLRWEHTRSAASNNSGAVKTWSPDDSAYWVSVLDGSVSTGKQIRHGAQRFLADETAFSVAKLNAAVIRLGFMPTITGTERLRIQDVHEEWALPEAAAEQPYWDTVCV